MESRLLRTLALLSILLFPRGAFAVFTSTSSSAAAGGAAAAAGGGGYFSNPYTSIERKVEEEAGVELSLDVETHRRILASINPGALNPDRAACIGPCPARGGSYTGRGCNSYYHCRS